MFADPRGVERAPLAAGAQDEQDAIHRRTTVDPRVVATERMRFPGRQKRLHPLPQWVRNSPTIVFANQSHAVEQIRDWIVELLFGATCFQAIDLIQLFQIDNFEPPTASFSLLG